MEEGLQVVNDLDIIRDQAIATSAKLDQTNGLLDSELYSGVLLYV